ncbi:CLUMA_CG018629, isoform A [Clunio marinus]|uniref:CLUMA_CG018629, isoform A n=1 Tax=Clunio marinus TaxID=568069 RepID=A0A1J1J327_9DIPT|nr:CLUMA_CG018629, isoform A [Clunio marinus]
MLPTSPAANENISSGISFNVDQKMKSTKHVKGFSNALISEVKIKVSVREKIVLHLARNQSSINQMQ